MKQAGHVARMEKMINAYILVRNPEIKTSFRKPGRRGENNITMDLRRNGWEVVDWIHLAQEREQWRAVVNTVMNLRVP
jgi:hypothetical protein